MTNAAEQLDSLIDQLSAEHTDLRPDLDALQQLSAGRNSALKGAVQACSAKLGEPLNTHIIQEDTILFPGYTTAGGADGLVNQFVEEHRQILRLRDDLLHACKSGNDEAMARAAASLAELLGDHMRREDIMLFPAIRDALR